MRPSSLWGPSVQLLQLVCSQHTCFHLPPRLLANLSACLMYIIYLATVCEGYDSMIISPSLLPILLSPVGSKPDMQCGRVWLAWLSGGACGWEPSQRFACSQSDRQSAVSTSHCAPIVQWHFLFIMTISTYSINLFS